jgi:hypothetical protein
VGNGFVTLLPTILFTLGLTVELMPARVLGMLGLLLNYQMLYGAFFLYSDSVLVAVPVAGPVRAAALRLPAHWVARIHRL